MKKIEGFNMAEVIKDIPAGALPKGAYEMRILGVTLKEGKTGR